MATPTTIEAIRNLPVTQYSDLRSNLVSGDLIFCSGNYFVSNVTRCMTHSPWSHVGIIFCCPTTGRVLLLESVENSGVRFAPLSKYTNDYDNGEPYFGEIVIARSSFVTTELAPKIVSFGMDLLTKPYDFIEMAKILSRIIFGIGRKEQNRAYICSELTYECFKHVGKEFDYNPQGFISPNDIWLDDSVSLIARVQ